MKRLVLALRQTDWQWLTWTVEEIDKSAIVFVLTWYVCVCVRACVPMEAENYFILCYEEVNSLPCLLIAVMQELTVRNLYECDHFTTSMIRFVQ